MVRLFETRHQYNERMKRRSNLLTSNANLVKLIKEYRNLENKFKRGIKHLPYQNRNRLYKTARNTGYAIVNRAQKRMSHGANTRRNYFPLNNSYYRRLSKILAAVPNTRNRRVTNAPKHAFVHQPNGNMGLATRI
jgi:hypothetical protein